MTEMDTEVQQCGAAHRKPGVMITSVVSMLFLPLGATKKSQQKGLYTPHAHVDHWHRKPPPFLYSTEPQAKYKGEPLQRVINVRFS
jgi:hypothetical protein